MYYTASILQSYLGGVIFDPSPYEYHMYHAVVLLCLRAAPYEKSMNKRVLFWMLGLAAFTIVSTSTSLEKDPESKSINTTMTVISVIYS